jgi:hypothetical protein
MTDKPKDKEKPEQKRTDPNLALRFPEGVRHVSLAEGEYRVDPKTGQVVEKL